MTAKHFARLLVPSDFSAGAQAAAAAAAALAGELDASIDLLTVVDTSPLAAAYGDPTFRSERIAAIHAEAQQEGAAFADRHFGAVHQVRVHVGDGDPCVEILRAARELGSDLIVMGTHGRTGLAHLLIGSVAEKVVRKSPVAVMTVRRPE